MQTRIHHLAVWILVVIHQFVGFGWYFIFGETWLNLHAKEATDIERTDNVWAYIFAAIAAIIVNYALACLISRLNGHTGMAGLRSVVIFWLALRFEVFA